MKKLLMMTVTLWSVGRVWGAGLEEIVMRQARQAQIEADRYALQANSLRKLAAIDPSRAPFLLLYNQLENVFGTYLANKDALLAEVISMADPSNRMPLSVEQYPFFKNMFELYPPEEEPFVNKLIPLAEGVTFDGIRYLNEVMQNNEYIDPKSSNFREALDAAVFLQNESEFIKKEAMQFGRQEKIIFFGKKSLVDVLRQMGVNVEETGYDQKFRYAEMIDFRVENNPFKDPFNIDALKIILNRPYSVGRFVPRSFTDFWNKDMLIKGRRDEWRYNAVEFDALYRGYDGELVTKFIEDLNTFSQSNGEGNISPEVALNLYGIDEEGKTLDQYFVSSF